MAKTTKLRALNNQGIQRFSDFLTQAREQEASDGKRLALPLELLATEDFLEKGDFEKKIDADQVFDDRSQLGAYLLTHLGADFIKKHEGHVGLWTWLTLLWFEQLRARDTQRHEHFIPYEWFKSPIEFFNSHQNLAYRHAVRTSSQLAVRFGGNARFFVSKQGTAYFGDASEQILSRAWFKSSAKVQELLFSLYQDHSGFMRKNALDKPPLAAKSKGSKTGYGGVRRLAINVLPRVKLTHDIDMMTTTEIVKICGDEFSSTLKKKKSKQQK